jgi:hypothetical protein
MATPAQALAPGPRHVAGGQIFFIGLMAIVIDVSWYQRTPSVQRAADSAALAGAVYLPGNVPNGKKYALQEAEKNGYGDGLAVTAGSRSCRPDGTTSASRRTVSALVGTFLHAVFGINSITATRTAKDLRPAGPDGQPGELLRIYRSTTTTDRDATTKVPDATGSGTLNSRASGERSNRAVTSTTKVTRSPRSTTP